MIDKRMPDNWSVVNNLMNGIPVFSILFGLFKADDMK